MKLNILMLNNLLVLALSLVECYYAHLINKSDRNADFSLIRAYNFLKPTIGNEMAINAYDISDNTEIRLAYWGQNKYTRQMAYAY